MPGIVSVRGLRRLWKYRNGVSGNTKTLTEANYLFTYPPLVPHLCVNELGQHWFGYLLAVYSAPSHYLKQWWVIVNWTPRDKLQWNFNQSTNFSCTKMPLKLSSAKRWPMWRCVRVTRNYDSARKKKESYQLHCTKHPSYKCWWELQKYNNYWIFIEKQCLVIIALGQFWYRWLNAKLQ